MNLQQLQTRFLWPFFIARNQFDHVEGALGSAWVRQPPPQLYREELLAQADAFFSDSTAYFRYGDPPSLFPQALTATLSRGVFVPVKVASGGGVELFLTREGVGVLSITLSVTNVPPRTAVDFDYRLARVRGAPSAALHAAHPSEDPSRWARIAESDRRKIRQAPSPEAPMAHRIGALGGTFTLAEVVEHLMAPLATLHPRGAQAQLSVYAVASFDSSVAFDQQSCVTWGGALLSALAQIEEPMHASAIPGTVDLPNAIMNSCHWAAVGMLGAAHLIADQPPPEDMDSHPFNAERMHRVRDKYFVPYLLALIQRLVLNNMADEAVKRVRSGDVESLRALRTRLLEFGIGGRFSQVSSRQALHRFYRLAQDGLDVREAWGDVRNALSDIDASNVASNVANNLGAITRLQHSAHTLESVVISVYCAELWHMFASDNNDLYEVVRVWMTHLLPPDRTLPHDWFVAWGVAIFAAMGWVSTYLYNRYGSRQEGKGDADFAP